ncbi:malectin domain-containing carbohydrate-binding protein [Cyclobacterium jeungdonense]|uniref:Malectin domain-containing carbohydrate-binding protein n=1 Tax=Cyclobacterium jeungdonense TaxID=708087 RepID=A0ABT8C8P3_9BACT|nr:malectin domain-containing carbohydrate-binding protein [Cyclobacterium jeungdonense]MDN3688895.1 malectin domain-containing carbohydrate-binding protein [Cyclobacterium jeungdonense]
MKPKTNLLNFKLFKHKKTLFKLVFLAFPLIMIGNGNKAYAYYFQNDTPKNTLGKELWTAGHEGGNQNEWSLNGGGGEFNSGSGNSSVSTDVSRSGNYSLKMSINTTNGGGHGTRNFRWSELGDHDDLIFTQYFYFPNRIDLDRNNDWFNLIQTKGVKFAPGGAGTGPDQINDPHFVLGLKVRGGAGSGGANFLVLSDLQKFWGSEPDVSWAAPAEIDLPVKTWVKIQMRIIQDRGDNGRILVWQDDQLIIDTKLRNTLRPEVDMNMFSINAYADQTYPTTTNVYLDDVSIHLPGTQEAPAPILPPSVNIVSPENNSTVISSTEVEIQAQANSANNTEITKVDFYVGNNIIGTSTNSPHSMKWSNSEAGTYKIKAVARDENNMVGESEEITLTITPPVPEVEEPEPQEPQIPTPDPTPDPNLSDGNPLINMNLGSTEGVIYNANSFEGEPRESIFPYNTYTYNQNSASQELLFQTERNAPDLRIEIPIENGIYKVITYHNELYFGINGPSATKGRRVFNIEIEGDLVKENLDLFSESGNKPLELAFENVEITDGKISIRMQASSNRATISGLTVIPQTESTDSGFEAYQQFINAGSSKDVFYKNEQYNGDDSYNTQATFENKNASVEELFQTERHSVNLKYAIPVPNGTYTVKTYHNELWFGHSGPSSQSGRRVYDILLEGEVVKNKFDLFEETGNNPAELIFNEITVKDGVLNLDLVAFSNRASISGIAITRTKASSGENLRVLSNETPNEVKSEELVTEYGETTESPRIYPNPASENVFVDLGLKAESYRYFVIHDMQGRLVNHFFTEYLSSDNGKYSIPVSDLKQGVYLVSLVDKNNDLEKFRLMVNP